jgi:hypothetical protein
VLKYFESGFCDILVMFIIAPVSQDSRLEPQPSESSPDTNKEMCRTGRTLIMKHSVQNKGSER